MHKYSSYLIITLSYIFGGGSLIVFVVFCYTGSLGLVELGLSERGILLFDGCLSLVFFLQHSGMVRKPFRRYLSGYVPEAYVSAIYAVASGIVLFTVVILWQETSGKVATAEGFLRFVLRSMFVASMAGFYWGVNALGFFDPFGVKAILHHLYGKKQKEVPLTFRGPYRWVRHPLYLCVLIMIWSYPDLTYDRLLFNVLWTVWIYIGALYEEGDMVADFGDAYRQYQRKVPMLIPSGLSPSWPKHSNNRMID